MRLRNYFNIILDFELRCSTNWSEGIAMCSVSLWKASFSSLVSSMSKAEEKSLRTLNFKLKRPIEKYSFHAIKSNILVFSRVFLFSWVRRLGNILTQRVEIFQTIKPPSIFEKSLLRSLIIYQSHKVLICINKLWSVTLWYMMRNKLTIIVSEDITCSEIGGDFFSEGQVTIFPYFLVNQMNSAGLH